MIALIAENKDKIAEICCAYRVRRLDLFGSAASGDFNPETSDIDFIVDLGGMSAVCPSDSFASRTRSRLSLVAALS